MVPYRVEVPDYLSDGNYILGLIEKYKMGISYGRHHAYKTLVWVASFKRGYDNMDLILEADKSLRCAVALAAIKLWKEDTPNA